MGKQFSVGFDESHIRGGHFLILKSHRRRRDPVTARLQPSCAQYISRYSCARLQANVGRSTPARSEDLLDEVRS